MRRGGRRRERGGGRRKERNREKGGGRKEERGGRRENGVGCGEEGGAASYNEQRSGPGGHMGGPAGPDSVSCSRFFSVPFLNLSFLQQDLHVKNRIQQFNFRLF